jgi:hypothetical protein
MREYTNIKHKIPKTDKYCSQNLYKEFWGNSDGSPDWHMTCVVCGFAEIINNETFLKWQYCDCVAE